jgi:uncharacterized integral membrane protein
MVKLITTVLVTAFLIFFAMNNMDHVQVSFVFGEPKRVRLFYLMISTFLVGFLLSYILSLYLQTKTKNKKLEKMRKLQKLDKNNVAS